jgi:hypothetical protein
VPAAAGRQVPLVPVPCCSAAAHATHSVSHAVLQQTPSTQKPLWHSSLVVQTPPLALSPMQWPPLQ